MNKYALRNDANNYATRAFYQALGYSVPSKYAKYKDPNLMLDYSHYKTKKPNRKFIKNVNHLFSNSDVLRTSLNFYYSVISPKSAQIAKNEANEFGDHTNSKMVDFHGNNPFVELNKGYSALAHHFKNENRKDKRNYTKILREHVETSKHGMNPHPHDNLLILSTKSIKKSDLSGLVSEKYYDTSHVPNNTQTNHVASIKPGMDKKAKKKAKDETDTICYYIEESTSQEPYCKHSNKSKKFKKDIKDTPDLASYINGVSNSKKEDKHPLSHTARFSSVMNNLGKVNKAARGGNDFQNDSKQEKKEPKPATHADLKSQLKKSRIHILKETKINPDFRAELINIYHHLGNMDKVHKLQQFNSEKPTEAKNKASKGKVKPKDYRTEITKRSVRSRSISANNLPRLASLDDFDVHESSLGTNQAPIFFTEPVALQRKWKPLKPT